MKEMQWTFIDRSKWSDGPWTGEPDKVQWTDPSTGMPCMTHRVDGAGHWCGYVGVGPEHPFYEKRADDLPLTLAAHGGVNFTNHCAPDHNPETGEGICHLPEPGEPDNLWWIGFDCGRGWDFSPGTAALFDEISEYAGKIFEKTFSRRQYRDLDYVRNETTMLAAQLARLP